jgi:Icc-related predicted phosphoesterase
MKIFALSDLHVDYPDNMRWLQSLSMMDYQEDLLILAGDISDSVVLLESCFKQLSQRFKTVMYVPGNHDLWVIRSRQKNSFEKFEFVQTVARESGIKTGAFESDGLSIVPLLGWYDYSFGLPSEGLKNRWMDFIACKWPQNYNEPMITKFFTSKNVPLLEIKNNTIITFSHFLPRVDLIPKFVSTTGNYLHPVLGSSIIEEQIRKLNPIIHVYGHSHINQNITKDNICYINNAFGTPNETRITKKALIMIYER